MIIVLTPLPHILGLALPVVYAETGVLASFFVPGDTLLFTTGLLAAGSSSAGPTHRRPRRAARDGHGRSLPDPCGLGSGAPPDPCAAGP